jgi:hypothetical protein
MDVHTCTVREFSGRVSEFLRMADAGDAVRVVDARSGAVRWLTAQAPAGADGSDLDAARLRRWALRGLRHGAPGRVGAAG